MDRSPSKTALLVCAYRARASRWDKPLFVDPWAEALAGDDGAEIASELDRRGASMERWFAVRTTYLDRLVGQAIDRLPASQIVILGAGYDTRAARLARPGVRFFEVDHPATQTAKRERLARLPGYPDAATYVSCDFEREDPIDRLTASGFERAQPTFVIWEGVVMYLTETSIRRTLSRLATGLDPRSALAFDFVGGKLGTGLGLSPADEQRRSYVGELGEPLVFGTDDIVPLLHNCGFPWARSVCFEDLAPELLGGATIERHRLQHIAVAALVAEAALQT
ncbi:MAG TPA: class I SAM-dependent methyltransferase [Kofleriaceae bacterium]